MKLYYCPGTCSLAPQILLKAAGIHADLEQVTLSDHRTASGQDFFTINPLGQVPVLELANGERLTEGAVILQYLADQVPGGTLLPALGDFQRYPVLQWLNRVATEFHKGYSPLFNPQLADTAKNLFREQLRVKYEWLDRHLATQDYLAGGSFSVADAYLFTVTRWTEHVQMPLQDLLHLQGYLQRISEKPAVISALEQEAAA